MLPQQPRIDVISGPFREQAVINPVAFHQCCSERTNYQEEEGVALCRLVWAVEKSHF